MSIRTREHTAIFSNEYSSTAREYALTSDRLSSGSPKIDYTVKLLLLLLPFYDPLSGTTQVSRYEKGPFWILLKQR